MLGNKTAVITGASRGIGRAIALKYAQSGADIAVIFNNGIEAAEEVCREAMSFSVKVKSFQCDVSDFASSKQTVEEIISHFGKIDILVNNAGITKDNLILKMSEQDFSKVIDVNLKGAFNMIRHTCRQFMQNRQGRIINITSVSGISGNAGQSNYSSAKAGLIGLTKSVAKELAARNITCNAIAPGFISTDMTNALSEKIKDSILQEVPLGRMGLPSEVAELAVFLASDLSAYITGEVIRIDGGMCM